MDTHPANVGLLMQRIQAEAKALQAEIKAFQAREERAKMHEQHHITMASIESQTHSNQQQSAQIDLAASRLVLEQKSAFFKLKFGTTSPADSYLMGQPNFRTFGAGIMLTAFATELNSTQSELEALLAKVEALKGQMKSLKATENKVSKVIESLKNLVAELPEVAINELKKEILSLFPSDPQPTKEPTEIFTNFVTEVPKTEEVNDRWNPTHFEPLEFQAETNGQLNLLQPTTTEPPEPDDYPDLASFEKAWEEWGKKQPEIETAIAKVNVSELCFYLKKPNQEIVAAYFAMANRNVGKEWADYFNLIGCNAEVKKAENFANGVRWEVLATRISHDLILQVDKNRPSLYSSVPAGNAEYTKKSMTGHEKTSENLDDLKTPQVQSSSQLESVKITTEKNLLTN